MFTNFQGFATPPGVLSELSTFENQVLWDHPNIKSTFANALISGAARDVGNTSYTHILRQGLLLGQNRTTRKFQEWNPTGTNGSELIAGILLSPMNMLLNNANQDRMYFICTSGPVRSSRLIIPGNASLGLAGDALEYLVRRQMGTNFQLVDGDDGLGDLLTPPLFGGFNRVQAKTADYTVLYDDQGTLFTNRGAAGAVNFTLPALPLKGLHYGFFVVADQTVTVTSAAANQMICFNDVDADAIAFSTSSEKVGGMIEVYGDGTSWLTKVSLGAETQTPTITT